MQRTFICIEPDFRWFENQKKRVHSHRISGKNYVKYVTKNSILDASAVKRMTAQIRL